MGEDGAVDEFDEGVDGGLRMDDDLDLVGAHAEEPVGFDDFETLVHHGGGIDSDAIAHAPIGVMEGLLDGDVGELRKGRFAERAARSGEDEAADFRVERSGEWRVASGERRVCRGWLMAVFQLS